MKVALVTTRGHDGCTLKDVAGGFGTHFEVGSSWPARLLERAKARMAALPNVTLGYVDRLFTDAGATVVVQELRHPADLVAADLVLIESSIVDWHTDRAVGAHARELGIPVGAFNTFAATCPEAYEDTVDFVVRGDMEALVPRLVDGEQLRGTVDAGFVPDLDALPFPRWHGFPVERYHYRPITRRGVVLPVLGSRGCAYTCDYCPYLVGSRFRTRSIESLVDEIDHLVTEYDARGISFRDPLRLFDHGEAERFLTGLQRKGREVRFSMECRTDRLDEELIDLLHRAGLRSLEIGVENADPAVVDARHRRPPALEHTERIVARCHQVGVRVIANFMLGLPNDDREGMRATAAYARRLNTFAVQFTVATPYPGTALHDEVADRIRETDWERFNGWTNVFRHPSMTPEQIHALREQAYVRYHFRPGYAWRFLTSMLRD